ncbi:MAG TPA: SAM-dependent chlorinase/fluorinase [Ilumatobacteraceae bacterium]|nr:SAM-dependent chlorinase/fluorinase [Ilumatobacteraceae bacterium]
MGRRYETVSFLSDFGTADEFVGVVHSVIRDLAPHARVIDLTHGVAPFDVRAGSLALARSISYVASGVVLAVVDPGVATTRRAIAVEVAGGEGVLVGPDNGLLAPAVALAGGAERAVELTDTTWHLPSPGATFAGRDVFAPAAAQLCNGVDLTALGASIDPDLLLPGVVALPQADDDTVIAQVLWVDRYGNAQLNVGPDDLPDRFGARIDLRFSSPTDPTGGVRRSALRAGAYAELGGGTVGLVLDSSGLLAVSMDQRSAAEELGLDVGDQVTLTASDDDGITQQVTLRRQP